MKRFVTRGICVFSVMMIVATYAETSPAIGEMQKTYNSETVTTVKCHVEKVGQVSQIWGPIKGMSYGVKLLVNRNEETLTVYLGPAWFIERQNISIEKDDIIEVKVCKKLFEGESVIVAQEIKKGDVVLKLRDKKGVPVWAGARVEKVRY
jgi:hypothetical protein